jgi:phosphoribosylglycinamide formyltransferase-1
VLPGDDEHTLADRILVQEHVAYTEAIALVAAANYRIEGRRVLINAGQTARG